MDGCNGQLHYQITGDQRLPLLVLLHGFLGRGDDFGPIVAALRSQFCCLSIDLPGHGQSLIDDPAMYTMAATARSIIAILDQIRRTQLSPSLVLPNPVLSNPAVTLYGYSMGGRLGLYLALHYPQYFDRVILAAASAGLKTTAEREIRNQVDRRWAEQLLVSDFTDFLQAWYAQPLFDSLTRHPDFDIMLTARTQNQPAFLAKSLLGMGLGRQPDWRSRLVDCDRPIRLLAGEWDQKFMAIQAELVQLSTATTMQVIPQAGHNVQFENPAAIIREIASGAADSDSYNASHGWRS
jgi:2-succinyl-6-hydroxy-2,4-cyclohexadiene-1-carboxylate synthase